MVNTDYLSDALADALSGFSAIETRGRVLEAVGTLIKASGVSARVGDICELRNPGTRWQMQAEVVGIVRDLVLLMPFGELAGLSTQTEVVHLGRTQGVKVGSGVLGRVLDGFGEPIDGLGPIDAVQEYPVYAPAPDPLRRKPILSALHTGVRAIDAFLTCGEGQRMGIFAPAGTGKSSLLSMISHGAAADVTVVALVGERGREVGEFFRTAVPASRRDRTVFVVATSDRAAGERAKAPCVATAIAEYFRDQGRSVLLLVDSVTRYARALREIGLAAGEPPTRRGFPPSVFTVLPKLFERAGQNEKGAISAFYTVLVDDDEAGDPIGEEVRSTLDGHIILSAKLAAANHYPAIDTAQSRSRVMNIVASAEHQALAGTLRELSAKYQSIEMLLQIGEYEAGSDAVADRAIRTREACSALLRQAPGESSGLRETLAAMRNIAAS